MVFPQRWPYLLLCSSLHTPIWGFLLPAGRDMMIFRSEARCVPQAHDHRLPLRWCSQHSNARYHHQQRPFWYTARGGGSRGQPPPSLAVGTDSGEKASEARAAESAHLKLRTMGQGKRTSAATTATTTPWRWVVVDEDKHHEQQQQREEEKEEEEEEGGKGDAKREAAPTAEESSSKAIGMVDAVAAGSTAEAPSNSGNARGGDSDGDGDGGGVHENSGDHDGGSAAAAEGDGDGDGDGDRLPPGQARLLEYRSPPGGAGGERGETRYASLGDDVSKFITFLESPVARGIRDGDADELDLAVGTGTGAAEPAAGTERRIFASTVEIAEEGLQQGLKQLWGAGRLLSQERDAANVLRGQEQSFSELLASYTNRTKSNHWEEIPPERLLGALEAGCGPDARSVCGYDPARPAGETLSSIKALLEWFRKDFPYYYDGCHSCGNGENNTFVGYVNPTPEERDFRAGRTEVYHCSACGSVNRFARYVAVSKVLETRRGRCGEYSVLMMRLLEALGYSCRWVVDWSDHVWVEARVGGNWVHIDPCEAAVDEPLLYESWGKKQTYILAFTPTEVVDVTQHYTSDYEAAKSRRDVDQDAMDKLLAEATKTLQEP